MLVQEGFVAWLVSPSVLGEQVCAPANLPSVLNWDSCTV